MKIFLLLMLLNSTQLLGQPCDCGLVTIRTKWPKSAEENNIYGIVKIRYQITDSCLLKDPVLIEKLGYGLDEEALRIFSKMALHHNQCNEKCGSCRCKNEELIFIVHFINPDIQEYANNIIHAVKCILIRFRIL